MSSFQKWLSKKLIKAEMSQIELSRRSGLSHFTINSWLKKSKKPRLSTLSKVIQVLADALNESYDDLLDEVLNELV